MEKSCTKCKVVKPADQFPRNRASRDGRCAQCKKCMAASTQIWREKNPEKKRAMNLRRKDNYDNIRAQMRKKAFGITKEEQLAMLDAQGWQCANPGCRTPLKNDKRTHLDHCHKTGAIRGFLCLHCNAAEGYLKGDPNRIRGLLEYLESHARRVGLSEAG